MGHVSMAVPYTDRWYFTEIVRGAGDRIAAAGHTTRLHVEPPGAQATLHVVEGIERDFAEAGSLGAIAVGIKYRPDQRERTLAWRRPVVVIGGSVTGFPTVMIDDIGASWIATDHLMQLGHTRIVHLAGLLEDQMDFGVHGRRAKGYRMAVERAGLPVSIVQVAYDRAAAASAAEALLAEPDRPTAIFAVSDEIAFGVIDAARDLGLAIGPDLSLVGFDDRPGAEEAGLTTIRQRPADLGALAAEMLLDGLDHGPDPTRSRLAPTALITRSSTRRLR